ncbi:MULTISPECIES: acyl-CoA carboxylase epsilon subunit [unclassified Frigoribacterium]|uniref:acyl-CoA carboxylase epsilon subunit n=1 Tax=unclassified Frigoribacterium TaxID=2627005 RepID=UPI0009EA2382|nr:MULTISPECIES: acyl-CoA carboxylase epsilon subunit [unclassified Frigoribacterium]
MTGRHAALPDEDDRHDDRSASEVLRVVSGRPTDAELAAVAAVLAARAVEAEAERAVRAAPATESAWSRSRRRPRGPSTSGPGQWRSFSG